MTDAQFLRGLARTNGANGFSATACRLSQIADRIATYDAAEARKTAQDRIAWAAKRADTRELTDTEVLQELNRKEIEMRAHLQRLRAQ